MHHDLPDWYRAADLTVLPSVSEGVPNVLLESIACGTPFVASRVGGIPEIASPGIDRLVAPGDPLELADAIEQHLSQATRRTDRCFRPESCAVAAEHLIAVIRSVSTGSSLASCVSGQQEPGVEARQPDATVVLASNCSAVDGRQRSQTSLDYQWAIEAAIGMVNL